MNFNSNGKLLITGEYLILDGAQALALPTKYGQDLEITSLNEPKLIWESFTNTGDIWLQIEFDLPRLRIVSESFDSTIEGGNDSLALKLQEIVLKAKSMNPDFLNSNKGYYAKSTLSFPRNWGLGSSSTLINNIAQWANVDAFDLQFSTIGGSAYDIACAQNNAPILYQLKNKNPYVESLNFDPSFKEQLYFVHLNIKQNSREAIVKYRNFKGNVSAFVEQISKLTIDTLTCSSLSDFEKIMLEHERIISSIIKLKPIQEELFSDYFGQTKSLGAWGGDFILATGNNDTSSYFNKRGFKTVIPYQEMIL